MTESAKRFLNVDCMTSPILDSAESMLETFFFQKFSYLRKGTRYFDKWAGCYIVRFYSVHFVNIIFTHSASMRGDLGFSILPKGILGHCRLEEPGIKPPTFWSADESLYILSHKFCRLKQTTITCTVNEHNSPIAVLCSWTGASVIQSSYQSWWQADFS